MKRVLSILLFTWLLVGCSEPEPGPQRDLAESPESPVLLGKWIKEADGSIMLDPQTSGLAFWRDQLVSISDGSADESQRRRIHVLDPATATLNPKPNALQMSSRVRRSCFSSYLSSQPDLEALVVDPNNDKVFYLVTEDATRTGALSPRCQQRFANSGSTDYPTLLVRVELSDDNTATMTHTRPLRFDPKFGVGDFPNDGIEGMAITPDGQLYLGLEKDKLGNARIFSVQLDSEFWRSSEFVDVVEPNLRLPQFNGGNHPINAMTWVPFGDNHPGYIIAAARNDDEIWIIDLLGKKPAYRQQLTFAAEIESPSQCGESEIMDNYSIEGIAVIGDTLWLVNDPWKLHYLKNVRCQDNEEYYQAMAPLLTSMPLNPAWFE